MDNAYPFAPGSRGADTSVEAGRSLAIAIARLQRVALRAIRSAGGRGLTTHELAAVVNIHRDAIQPRTSELRRRGLIRDSGGRRRNSTGKRAIVWTATGGAE